MPKYRVRKGKWLIISFTQTLSSRWQDRAYLPVTETFWGKIVFRQRRAVLDEGVTKGDTSWVYASQVI